MHSVTAWDLVGQGFRLLAEGLTSFVDQRMRHPGPDYDDWADRLAALDQERYGNSRRLSKNDPAVLLRAIHQEWRNFADVLPREARHYAGELRETRNRWAHNEVDYFTARRARRAMETMYLLLAETGDAGVAASRAIGELIEQPDNPEGTGLIGTPGATAPATPPPPLDDDVMLLPVAGICRLQDDHAMLRTRSFIPGPDDVVVPGSYVEGFGLRDGDVLEGAVRDGGKDQSGHSPLARLDKVNGLDPEKGPKRREFDQLTAVAPSRRLRLETGRFMFATRVIDLIAPLEKGHRVLTVTPAGRGKLALIEQMADGFSKNNMDLPHHAPYPDR